MNVRPYSSENVVCMRAYLSTQGLQTAKKIVWLPQKCEILNALCTKDHSQLHTQPRPEYCNLDSNPPPNMLSENWDEFPNIELL